MIHEIIESVVDEMKVFSFTSASEDGSNIYTFVVTEIDYWAEDMRMIVDSDGTDVYGYVTDITGNNLKVNLGATSLTTFTNLRMDINYKHGHPVDVFAQLSEMAQHDDYKMRRFPVVALMQDYDESMSSGISETSIQVILATDTKPEFHADQRYTYSYEGRRLTKLYERFIKYLEWDPDSYFRKADHQRTYRLYWGQVGALGNEANKAESFIDAIEINIELKTLNTC